MECTGIFNSKEAAGRKHLEAGAKKVLVSAPASGADITVVYGVNHDKMRKSHKVVSNASCTTNCLVPVAHVLEQTVGIKHGFMTTMHSFTGDQPSGRHPAQGPAPGAGRLHVHDPHLDRRGPGHRPGAAGLWTASWTAPRSGCRPPTSA